MINRFLVVVLALAASTVSTFAASTETVCRRDEQRGCFSFQIVGTTYNQQLMVQVSAMSQKQQAKSLGMKVFEGMQSGRYDVSANQDYVLYLWMDDTYDGVPLPENRIVQTCFTGLDSGEYLAYKPRGLSKAALGGNVPTILASTAGRLGSVHTALAADCSGGVYEIGPIQDDSIRGRLTKQAAGLPVPYDIDVFRHKKIFQLRGHSCRGADDHHPGAARVSTLRRSIPPRAQ